MQAQSNNENHSPPAPQETSSLPARGEPVKVDGQYSDVQSNDPQKIEEERLKAYAHLLDSAIRLPGGFRIGLDGIVGLVPGIGDVLGAGLSGYFIYAASRLDIPRPVITRMIVNTTLETVIGTIPIIGDAFDFIFKANDRNARLLHDALEARNTDTETSDRRF